MNIKDFKSRNASRWSQYEAHIKNLEKGKNAKDSDMAELPQMLRAQCADLAIARHRMYGESLCEHLNDQVIRGHKLVAQRPTGLLESILRFLLYGFPQSVRREWKLFLVCWAFFLIPAIGMWASIYYDLDWVRSILGSDGMANMDSMYGKGDISQISEVRNKNGANFMMFSYYIHNNIGIDFQIIAGGALAGIGSLFILLMNGLAIGGSMAYVIEYGSPEKFFSFVSGHASYELTGMVVAGMAGMRIGLGILNPGRMTRGRALLESGKLGLPLVYGAFLLTFIAACVEGFWSSHDFDLSLKYTVGFVGWFAIALYFIFVGRGRVEA